jgi:nucleoside-diphosphate-sugar epimerase
MKRLLITGGSGFIGRNVLAHLKPLGYEVFCVTNVSSAPSDTGVTPVACDLMDAVQVDDVMQRIRPTHLLHLAWYTAHGAFWTSERNLAWTGASLNLIRSFATVGGTRAVFAGTCAEYDWSAPSPFNECLSPTKPATLYGVCKNSLRQVLEAYTNRVGVSIAWGRVFFLYGPGEHQDRLVPSIIRSLLNDKPVVVRASGHVRDILHVTDVASGFAQLLDSGVTGPTNVAFGQGIELGTLAREIASIVGREELLTLGLAEPTPENPASIVAKDGKLREATPWNPTVRTRDGLAELVDWHRHQSR